MTITFDADAIKLANLFESITKVPVKHLGLFKDMQFFVVPEGNVGKALGKNKEHLLRLEKLLNRKIKIVEHSPDVRQFIANLILPNRVDSIVEENGIVTLSSNDVKTKGLIIGAKAQNLRKYEEITKEFFPIQEIKVV